MKTVLITGSTGALGSALVPELLRQPDVRLVLLIRPSRGESPERRFAGLKQFWQPYGLDDSVWERVETVEGDVAVEQLGLGTSEHEKLCSSVSVIVHGAAQVKINMSEEEARLSCMLPTQRILRFAENVGSLEKLEYISTIGVAGDSLGAVREERLPKPESFHNTYESSKYEAEEAVWASMDQGLPATIHRPSMVVGDSSNGLTSNFQVFYHLTEFLSGRATGGWVPRLPHFILDVVPNDFVSKAIAASVRHPDWAGKVLHLCSGREGSLSLESYVNLLPSLFSRSGSPTNNPHRLPWHLFRALVPVAALLAPPDKRKAFQHLHRFLSYLRESAHFLNQNTMTLLAREGIALPTAQEFLPQIMDYYVKSKRFNSARDEHGKF